MPAPKTPKTNGRKRNAARIGMRQEKILLMLCAGVALGFAYTPHQYFRVLKEARKEWRAINKRGFIRSVESLHENGFVTYVGSRRGAVKVQLTKKGKKEGALRRITATPIPPPPVWDGRWHVVAFDIPMTLNSIRDMLRYHLKRLGFLELQRSIFIYPFPARDQIETVADHLSIHKYLTYMRVDELENEDKLIRFFELTH